MTTDKRFHNRYHQAFPSEDCQYCKATEKPPELPDLDAHPPPNQLRPKPPAAPADPAAAEVGEQESQEMARLRLHLKRRHHAYWPKVEPAIPSDRDLPVDVLRNRLERALRVATAAEAVDILTGKDLANANSGN
jgi:hypothetical protein